MTRGHSPLPLIIHTYLLRPGVESYDVSLEKQTVVVKGSAAPEAVLEAVKKTGKKTELVSSK